MAPHRKKSLAHELTNALAIIMGECDLLQDVFKGEPAATRRLDIIKKTACRMADVINNAKRPISPAVEKIEKRSHGSTH